MNNMLFKKQPKLYNLEIDKLRDAVGVAINLKTLEESGYKILSIERINHNKEDEQTVAYTLKDENFDNHYFEISRAQHVQLISDWKNNQ